MKTPSRKIEHIEVCLSKDVESRASTGFERIRFVHYSLPEINFDEISFECSFLGKKLSAPFMVTAITGGHEETTEINKDIALACEREGIAMGLGSMRAMIENPFLKKTFEVRDVAPKIFLAGNIGAIQLKKISLKKLNEALSEIGADALCVHLNPLQEGIQLEGDKNWVGCLSAIKSACNEIDFPIIAKETGAGICSRVALELEKAGVKAIDVSGVGGSSWGFIEGLRKKGFKETGDVFRDWGISTTDSLIQCSKAIKIPLIASGGVRNGLDAAKAIRLGASLAGGALPFLKAQAKKGADGVQEEISKWKHELALAMLLTRSKNLVDLKKAELQESIV